MSAKLSEKEHRKYLEIFLDEAKDLIQEGKRNLISLISPYAQDNLMIARDVGYIKLHEEFAPLYQEVGLIK